MDCLVAYSALAILEIFVNRIWHLTVFELSDDDDEGGDAF